MSSENRGSSSVPPNTSIYTIYGGGHQGCMNYGFHPQAPPPKYEDVISGEYLKSNYPGNEEPPAATHNGSACHCSYPQATTPRVPPRSESEISHEVHPKAKNENVIGAVFFGLLLIVIFVWRVSVM